MNNVVLTSDLIESFAGTFLSPRYDEPAPTPDFHREGWALYCSPARFCELVAPRDHAKSTAFTFDYILAEVCFRVSDYVILIGSTEDMAAEQLSNLREELDENQDLRKEFGIASFEQDSKTDIIVRCDDGHRFRILARGAEQKIRGKMWKGKRPNLIVGDDMEDDEQVENKDRRTKFRNWFFRAAVQAISQSGKVRVHGTILHEDSLLSRLRKMNSWKHLYYKAHTSFNDFSNMLWPQRWTKEKLLERRQSFIDDGDSAGYAQEFLNEPADTANPYLRKDDFIDMAQNEREAPKVYGVGVDFAISKKDKANRTSFTVGGKTIDNLICVVDQRVDRMGSLEIIEEFFSINTAWQPDIFWVEDGQIWKAISSMIFKEMQLRNTFLNIFPRKPIGDKAARGRPFQKQHRARCMRFDKDAEWYPGYEEECLKFRVESDATLDDQFDSTAHLVAGFESMTNLDEEDFRDEEEVEMERQDPRKVVGRSSVTGY